MPMGIDPFHDVSQKNKATITKYCQEIKVDGVIDKTVGNYCSMLIIMARHLKDTNFKNATETQMKKFFLTTTMKPASQETMKIAIKRFYRWLFKLPADEPFPPSVRWIKFRYKRMKRRASRSY